MATFEPAVQKIRRDKTYLVYIRIIQKSKPEYIKTDMYIHQNKVKGGEIRDHTILSKCYAKIKEFNDKLNNVIGIGV